MILQGPKFNPSDGPKPAALSAPSLSGPGLDTFYPGPFALQLASTLPAQPFVNHAFSVCMYLIDGHGQIVRGQKVPLILQVACSGADSSASSGSSSYFTCSPSSVFVDSDGVAEFSITFLPAALKASTRVFVLRAYLPQSAVEALGGSSAFPPPSIAHGAANGGIAAAPAATSAHGNGKSASVEASESKVLVFASKPMYIVTQRLLVTANLQSISGGTEKGGYVWYKDEGGRDHGIDLTIKLVDENDAIVRGQEIPLLIQLLYQNNDPVQKPNMLTLIDGSSTTSPLSSLSGNVFVNLHIDASSGIARTRLRINDISKNHQRQLFKVRVSADISKSALFGNVGSGETVGVEVKSKRTKRLREVPPMSGLGHGAGSANSFPFMSQKHAAHSKDSMGVYGDSLMYDMDDQDYGLPSLPSSKKTKSRITDPVIPLNEDQLDRMDVPPYMTREAPSSVKLASVPSSSGVPPPSSGVSLDHLRSVVKWTELVLDQLQAIRWKHVGYQAYLSDDSGSSRGPSLVSTSQPLYNIVNPNAIIDKLLQHYNEHVYSHLVALVPGSTNTPMLASSVAVDEPSPLLASPSRPRLHSLDHEGLADMHVPPTDRLAEPAVGEASVHYMLAIPYHSLFRARSPELADQMYFPAYGADQSLVGLYVELKNDRNATIIHFLPLDAQREAQLAIRKEPAQSLMRLLLANEQCGEEISVDSLRALGVYGSLTPEMLARAVYSRKKHRDLEAMKQDALVHYWVSQVAFDDF